MQIKFRGSGHNRGYVDFVRADVSTTGISNLGEYSSFPSIEADDKKVVVRIEREGLNHHLHGNYVVCIELTKAELTNLLIGGWGESCSASLVDALSSCTEQGKKAATAKHWLKKYSSETDGRKRDKYLRWALEELDISTT